MELASIGLFRLAAKRLDYLGTRHRVIAENVANADTPGFRARDLKPFDFQAAMDRAGGQVVAARTSPLHQAGLVPARPFAEDRRAEPYEAAPDGNAVVLEEQMMKAAEVRSAHDLATGLFQKHVSMIRHAFTSR